MIIEPKEYKQLENESTFTFKNAYVNYARFHADDVNTWIHIVFIPTLLTTQAALIKMYATVNRDLKFGMDGSIQLGVFDTSKSTEYVIGLWELFVMFLCVIYIRCDLVTGVFTSIMVTFQFALVKYLIEADKGETPLFGGNLWTFTLYLYLFGWTTQFVGHGIFEQRKPALMSNGLFAMIAPFFMVFEVLHKLTGYKSEELKQLNFVVEADIAHYRQASGIEMREGIELKKKSD